MNPVAPQTALTGALDRIEKYKTALKGYTEEQYTQKPSETAWSIGQMCTHLMDGWYGFFSQKINKCLESDEFAEESPSEYGQKLLTEKKFPALKIQGAPSSSYIPEPAPSCEVAIQNFEDLSNEMKEMAALLEQSGNSAGKRRHPAFGYLNAWEWFELSGIHLNHHWGQKERIDVFMNGD